MPHIIFRFAYRHLVIPRQASVPRPRGGEVVFLRRGGRGEEAAGCCGEREEEREKRDLMGRDLYFITVFIHVLPFPRSPAFPSTPIPLRPPFLLIPLLFPSSLSPSSPSFASPYSRTSPLILSLFLNALSPLFLSLIFYILGTIQGQK